MIKEYRTSKDVASLAQKRVQFPSGSETKNLKLTTDDYLSSRISLSLAADKSSIFFVSDCVTFSISSIARLCSSWLIFLSFSS